MEEEKTTNPVEEADANTADPPAGPEKTEDVQNTEAPAVEKSKKPKKKRGELSGAYWYSSREDAELIKNSQIRSLIHVIAFMLQIVPLALSQEWMPYVTYHIPALAYTYVWAVILTLIISLYVIIMDCVRNKIKKRIPVEKAPKNGFTKRAFFTAELDIAVNALIFVFELIFLCILFGGFGLFGLFLTAAATGLSVWARQIEHLTLRDAELIPAPDEDIKQELEKENNKKK